MDRISAFATEFWNYKISLLPLLATYILFDLPAIIRKVTGIAYVPIYFIFFPSGHSDRLYAQYFNEDWFYCDGETLSPTQRQHLRYRIQATAVLSMVFATILAPWLCGFIAAFYLTQNQFVEFLWLLLLTKAALIAWVLRKLRRESEAVTKGYAFYYLIALYIVYLFLIWRGLTKAYEWTHQNLQSNGFLGVALGLLDYAYIDIFINVVIVSALTWGLTILFTSPSHVREPNEVYEPTKTSEAG